MMNREQRRRRLRHARELRHISPGVAVILSALLTVVDEIEHDPTANCGSAFHRSLTALVNATDPKRAPVYEILASKGLEGLSLETAERIVATTLEGLQG